MRSISMTNMLRAILLADAATCFLMAGALTAGGGLLAPLLGLPGDLLFYAGLGLFPFAAFLAVTALRKEFPPTALWAAIALNVLWTLDSILLLAGGWAEPTAFGYGFVIFQAVGVAAFAALEFFGLRQAALVQSRNNFEAGASS